MMMTCSLQTMYYLRKVELRNLLILEVENSLMPEVLSIACNMIISYIKTYLNMQMICEQMKVQSGYCVVLKF